VTIQTPGARKPAGFWAIRLVFAMQAVTIAAWLPRIPDIKSTLELSDGILGLALAGLPAATLIGFLFAPRFADRTGLRGACVITGPVVALVFILPGLAVDALSLLLALFATGLVISILEVSMNAKAGQMEQEMGRRMMTQCHAFWSVGMIVGALIGGAFAQAGASVALQFLVINPVFAVVALYAASRTSPDRAGNGTGARTGFFTLPPKSLLLLCLMPVGTMGVEGSLMDWLAVYAREILAAEPVESAAVYAVFFTLMAVARLGGDTLATRYGAANVVLFSALSATVGVVLIVTAPGLWQVYAGAALAGFGVANVYPLAISAAAASPGASAQANVAAVAFISFMALLAGPPVIGGLADLFGLRVALAILAPAALASAVLYRATSRRVD